MKYATVVLAIAVTAFVIGCTDAMSTGPTNAGSAATTVLTRAASSAVHGEATFSAKVQGIHEKSGAYAINGKMKYAISEGPLLKRPHLDVETYVETLIESLDGAEPSFKFTASMSSRGFADEKGNTQVEVWYPVPDASFNVRMRLSVTRKGLSVSRTWLEPSKEPLRK